MVSARVDRTHRKRDRAVLFDVRVWRENGGACRRAEHFDADVTRDASAAHDDVSGTRLQRRETSVAEDPQRRRVDFRDERGLRRSDVIGSVDGSDPYRNVGAGDGADDSGLRDQSNGGSSRRGAVHQEPVADGTFDAVRRRVDDAGARVA